MPKAGSFTVALTFGMGTIELSDVDLCLAPQQKWVGSALIFRIT